MRKRFLVAITSVAMCLFTLIAIAAENERVFKEPMTFLGMGGSRQLEYVTGVLDALYFVNTKGPLSKSLASCLFRNDDLVDIQIDLHMMAIHAADDALERGEQNVSVVDVLIDRLEAVCSR